MAVDRAARPRPGTVIAWIISSLVFVGVIIGLVFGICAIVRNGKADKMKEQLIGEAFVFEDSTTGLSTGTYHYEKIEFLDEDTCKVTYLYYASWLNDNETKTDTYEYTVEWIGNDMYVKIGGTPYRIKLRGNDKVRALYKTITKEELELVE